MLVTFLLQKPKLLMKYFIIIFSYIIKIPSNNNIFVMLGGHVFHRVAYLCMGTNCSPLLFIYSYEADFMQGFFKK